MNKSLIKAIEKIPGVEKVVYVGEKVENNIRKGMYSVSYLESKIITDYDRTVFNFLEVLKENQIYQVKNLTKEETRPNFILAVKMFIDCYPDSGISFIDETYSSFRKLSKPQKLNE